MVKHSRLLHDAFQTSIPSGERENTPKGAVDRQKIGATSFACGADEKERSKVALPVVKVLVRANGREDPVRTFALLDPGSNKSFCSMELLKMLDIEGSPQPLTLDTLNTSSQVETLEVALNITGVKSSRGKVFHLPRVYALKDFPSLRDSCATSEHLSSYRYLADISVPRAHAEGVTILIGQDAPAVLMPLEVRYGNEGEPYAVRTSLGWTINGPVGRRTTEKAFSNFVQGNLESQVERFWKIDSAGTLADDSRAALVDDMKAVNI